MLFTAKRQLHYLISRQLPQVISAPIGVIATRRDLLKLSSGSDILAAMRKDLVTIETSRLAHWREVMCVAFLSMACTTLGEPAWPKVTPEFTDTPEVVETPRAAVPPDFSKPPNATVGNVGGAPCFLLDGKPFPMMWGAVWRWRRPGARARHGGMPFNVVTVFNDHRKWHPGIGKFEPKELDAQAKVWIRDNPDAYLMWDLTVTPSAEWAESHPGEMCADSSGKRTRDGLRANYSFASAAAREEMLWIVTKAIRYLESRPYANRIVGYRVNSGHTMEWLGWYPPRGRATDFSDAAKRGFAPRAVPVLSARSAAASTELLWNPSEHADAVAWADFYSQAGAETLIALCRRAKELTGGRKLVGTYYGYTMTLNSSGNSILRGGHYALKRVLDSGAVDFLLSPQPYEDRSLGDAAGEMKPFASMQRHGIVPIVEDDTRTHNGRRLEKSGYGQTLTEFQSRAVLRRNLSAALCRREPTYNYALVQGTEFTFAGAAEDGRLFRAVAEKALARGMKRHAEIAVVTSEEAVKAMPVTTFFSWRTGKTRQRYAPDGSVIAKEKKSPILTPDLHGNILQTFSRAGAPVDYLLAEDLADNPGDYKLYVFVNAYRTDKRFRAAAEALRKRGAVLCWIYAPGAMDGAALGDPTAMKAVTGLEIAMEREPHTAEAIMSDGRTMGFPGAKPTPLFSLVSADEALGTYTNGHIAVGLKRTGHSLSVFSGVWTLDVAFASFLARRAGVHVYSETDDPVEAADGLFTLHARKPGRKTVRLPRPATVVDVFNRRVVAREADTFSFDAPIHSSWLFYFGEDALSLPGD